MLQRLTGFPLTRGFLCAMRRPAPMSVEEVCAGARRLAVLEDLMNPTNVGAIFRSAAALGVDAVLLTHASSDPLYRRAIRVSMGTVFQVPWTWLPETARPWPELLRALGFKTAAMALREDGDCAVLISDCKYGYRGTDNTLALTLINSSTSPDPYPERGIHTINLWLGISCGDPRITEELADSCNHGMFYQPSNSHHGTLPMEESLLETASDSVVISAVQPSADGALLLRGYETAGSRSVLAVTCKEEPSSAVLTDLFEQEISGEAVTDGCTVQVSVEPYSLFQLKIR